ncbi:MAG: BlaI/MecI/CopY family transcriptional regulator [Terriglobales bacterium]
MAAATATTAATTLDRGIMPLGPLEHDVMEVLWRRGRCNVREVVDALTKSLAYTTVMTTLDRLFKKGLLEREKSERAFVYLPALSRLQWQQRRAGEFLANFFGGARPDALISTLVDAVEAYDAELLAELTHKIQAKRRELATATRRRR